MQTDKRVVLKNHHINTLKQNNSPYHGKGKCRNCFYNNANIDNSTFFLLTW